MVTVTESVTPTPTAGVSRQGAIVDQRVATTNVGLVGLGTVGSWCAPLLMKLGVGRLSIWDFDHVEWPNVSCQIYGEGDVDQAKAIIIQNLVADLGYVGGSTQLEVFNEKFKGEGTPPEVLISAVDNWAGRAAILDYAAKGSALYIEARMMARWSVIHAIDPRVAADVKWMHSTFGVDGKGPAVPCGNTGTAFLGAHVGAEIASMVCNYVNGEPIPRETPYDMGLHMVVGGEE